VSLVPIAPTEVGLRLQNVTFGWPGETPLLSDLTLEIPKGQIIALVGKSGCGKSTLLRLAAGLLQPSQGTVQRQLDTLSFVFQNPNLLPWRTLRENVSLPLELQGNPNPGLVDETIASVGLSDYASRLPGVLSGGMKMRTALARALVVRPEMMLLDEPFSALDAITRRDVQQEFLGLWRAHGFTAVLVTHDIDEAVLLADQVVVIGNPSGQTSTPFLVDLPRPRTSDLRHDPTTGAWVRRIESAL